MSATQTGAIIAGYQGLKFAQATLEGIVCGVILIGAHGQILSVSTEAEAMLGWETGQWQHASLDLLPAALALLAREALGSSKAAGVRLISLSGNGEGESAVSVRAVPLPLNEKESGVMLLLQELTAARHLESSLQQLNRLASTGLLAASTVHEIKNALVACKTFIELLLEKNPDAELAGIVRRELARLDDIIGRTLQFSAPAPAAFERVHLHEVLEQSLQLVQRQAENRRVRLHAAFRAAPELLEGDGHALQQAFVNLLLNAVEATGPDGSITVSTEWVPENASRQGGSEGARPARLRIIIEDTGSGIAAEHLPRLFEAFFTTKPGGTGLGLAITQRIIREHRGTISAESQPGKGTRFSILLPAS